MDYAAALANANLDPEVAAWLAGRRAAAIQSLLATAKLNGIEPLAWLRETLEKLPAWPNSRIDELLPLRPATMK